jgi:hypothetical protein
LIGATSLAEVPPLVALGHTSVEIGILLESEKSQFQQIRKSIL